MVLQIPECMMFLALVAFVITTVSVEATDEVSMLSLLICYGSKNSNIDNKI